MAEFVQTCRSKYILCTPFLSPVLLSPPSSPSRTCKRFSSLAYSFPYRKLVLSKAPSLKPKLSSTSRPPPPAQPFGLPSVQFPDPTHYVSPYSFIIPYDLKKEKGLLVDRIDKKSVEEVEFPLGVFGTKPLLLLLSKYFPNIQKLSINGLARLNSFDFGKSFPHLKELEIAEVHVADELKFPMGLEKLTIISKGSEDYGGRMLPQLPTKANDHISPNILLLTNLQSLDLGYGFFLDVKVHLSLSFSHFPTTTSSSPHLYLHLSDSYLPPPLLPLPLLHSAV